MNDTITIKEGRKVRATAWPNILCTMALIAIGCTPYLGYNISNAVKLVIALLWFLTIIILHPFNSKEKGFAIVVAYTIYLILQIVYSIIGMSREMVYFLARLHIYVIPMAMVYMVRYYNLREIKLLWTFFLLVFSANLASNIFIGLTQGEYAFRITEDTVNTNAGSTPFVVACMLAIPILWIVIRNCKSKILKYFSILLIVGLAYYIIILNTRATALIILIVILFGFMLVEFNRKRLTKGKLMFRMLLLGVVALLLIGPIMGALTDAFSENNRMLSRIEDMSYVMDQGNVAQLEEGSLYTRSILWMASINTFFSSVPHFLFGIGDSVIETDVFSLLANGVGNHSEFFDLAARYGLIGVIIYIFIIKHTYKFMNGLTDNARNRDYVFVFLIGLLLFGFANNLSNKLTAMLLIYFMLPMTVFLVDRKAI